MQKKPYSEMTEQERKDWFGKAFKRTNPQGVPEAYVCTVEPEIFGSGYGVVAKQYDPYGKYDIEELKQYLKDYPEMNCIGWIKPLTPEQQKLLNIRTTLTGLSLANIKKMLYQKQIKKFAEDDIWNSDTEGTEDSDYIFVWGEDHMTCDRTTELYTQYEGIEDDKAAQVLAIRNAGKIYLSNLADAYYEAHHGKPEPPVFPVEYVND